MAKAIELTRLSMPPTFRQTAPISARIYLCSREDGDALTLVGVPLLTGDGFCRQTSGFVNRYAENRERAFEYAFCMVGARVSSNDPTNGHTDQTQDGHPV